MSRPGLPPLSIDKMPATVAGIRRSALDKTLSIRVRLIYLTEHGSRGAQAGEAWLVLLAVKPKTAAALQGGR
jgi:hypothetical protein